MVVVFFFSSTRRHTRCALVTGVQTCALPIFDARVRAVVVPYAGGLETEQTLRAERLSAHTALQVVHEGALTPETLARAVDRALESEPSSFDTLNMDGARSVEQRVRKEWCKTWRSRGPPTK